MSGAKVDITITIRDASIEDVGKLLGTIAQSGWVHEPTTAPAKAEPEPLGEGRPLGGEIPHRTVRAPIVVTPVERVEAKPAETGWTELAPDQHPVDPPQAPSPEPEPAAHPCPAEPILPPSERPFDEYKVSTAKPVWENPVHEPPPIGRATPLLRKLSTEKAPAEPSRADKLRVRMNQLAPEMHASFRLIDHFLIASDRDIVKRLCQDERNFEYRTRGKRMPVFIRRCPSGTGGIIPVGAESPM